MKQVRRWLPERLLVLVVDGGFAAVALALACQEQQVTLVTRLRLDAALYHPPAPHRPASAAASPPKANANAVSRSGPPAPTPPGRRWTWTGMAASANGSRVFSRTALWYTSGWAPVAIRFVLVRDPEGKLPDAAFLCTDLQASPAQILAWVVMRWSVEVTFAEARAHLGIETQRQWSDPAIARTTPVLFGLFSLVTVLALRFCPSGQLPVETHRVVPQIRSHLRGLSHLGAAHLWRARYLGNSAPPADLVQLPREAFECLLE